MFNDVRDYLARAGYPPGDLNRLPDSDRRFPDGGQFRIEVPTVNSVEAAAIILEECANAGVKVDRIDQTAGGMLFTEDEHARYLQLGRDHEVEMCFGVGPRGTYDIGAQKLGKGVWAHAPAYRLRGMEQVVYAIEDLRRLADIGARTFLIYDEGLLHIAHQMRKDGELLPSDSNLMASAHMGHNNPVGYRILENLGADTVATQRDMELPMIAALRSAVTIPIHVHIDNPQATGGFIRTYDSLEMIRLGAPIYLKTGSSVLARHGMRMTTSEAEQVAQRVITNVQIMKRVYPEAIQSQWHQSGSEAVPIGTA